MKTLKQEYVRFTPHQSAKELFIKSQQSDIRQFIGLPKIVDTEKNCIHMHNAFVETEAGSINKHIGDIDNKSPFSDQNPSANPGIGNQFGY